VQITREGVKYTGVSDTRNARKVVTNGDYCEKAGSAFDTVSYRVFWAFRRFVRLF